MGYTHYCRYDRRRFWDYCHKSALGYQNTIHGKLVLNGEC
jgi:hypothetical protein